jgi:hypothetical protein
MMKHTRRLLALTGIAVIAGAAIGVNATAASADPGHSSGSPVSGTADPGHGGDHGGPGHGGDHGGPGHGGGDHDGDHGGPGHGWGDHGGPGHGWGDWHGGPGHGWGDWHGGPSFAGIFPSRFRCEQAGWSGQHHGEWWSYRCVPGHGHSYVLTVDRRHGHH